MNENLKIVISVTGSVQVTGLDQGTARVEAVIVDGEGNRLGGRDLSAEPSEFTQELLLGQKMIIRLAEIDMAGIQATGGPADPPEPNPV